MSNTKIQWAEKVWNPVTGCTKISPGCAHCYAEQFAARLSKIPNLKGKYKYGFEFAIHYDAFDEPYKWRTPKRVFVTSMGDLFHEKVSNQWRDKVFEVIKQLPQHTFMLLTKRPENMLEYMRRNGYEKLPNIWCGVSAENQQAANERIPILLLIKSPVRFVSCEPLLGPVHFNINGVQTLENLKIAHKQYGKVDWVIAGGESGNRARPMHPDWVNEIVHQCSAHKTPLFFKSWGAYSPLEYVLKKYPLAFAERKHFGLKYDGSVV
jgi:protein gp37